MTALIRAERESDWERIAEIHRAAFGGRDEADLVDALRADRSVEVSLVAEVDQIVIGHILFSRLAVITRSDSRAGLALAPMAIDPEVQRRGIGSQLVVSGLDACRKRDYEFVLVLGHPAYYPRFGFSSQLAKPLESPFGGGDAWMALELKSGSLENVEGRVEFAAPFQSFE